MEFTERNERTVTPQLLRNRCCSDFPDLVRIAKDELTGLNRCFSPGIVVNSFRAASRDERVMESVLEPEWITSFRQFGELQPIDERNLRSEERRVGKESRCRWWRCNKKK